jgi:hypothetical protein
MFVGNLTVRLIADDESGVWELIEPLSFKSDVAGVTITAPPGHQTDFCSVPRVPLAYDMLGNRARKAGVIHDRLYVTHELSREMADQVLREMLLLDGVGRCEAEAFYVAVRSFGGSHWGPDPATAA